MRRSCEWLYEQIRRDRRLRPGITRGLRGVFAAAVVEVGISTRRVAGVATSGGACEVVLSR